MSIRLSAVLALGIVLTGCSSPSPQISPDPVAVPEAAASASAAPQEIDWSSARSHLGSTQTICGPVVSTFTATSSVGTPTFVNIGVDYPDPNGFTVVIFDDYAGAFPFDPAIEYEGTSVCVTGEIRAHDEFVQIEARTPDQIEVRS